MDQQSFERITQEWPASEESYVPLDAAAAMVFHQARLPASPGNSPADLDDALNMAASALSRLIAIYFMQAEVRVVALIDLTSGSFCGGAAEFRRRDGGSSTTGMSVRRSEAVSALSFIARIGVPFRFAKPD